jgi:hypothetical protein
MAIIITGKVVWGLFTSCRSSLTFVGMWQFGAGYYYMIIKVLKNYDNFSQL